MPNDPDPVNGHLLGPQGHLSLGYDLVRERVLKTIPEGEPLWCSFKMSMGSGQVLNHALATSFLVLREVPSSRGNKSSSLMTSGT